MKSMVRVWTCRTMSGPEKGLSVYFTDKGDASRYVALMTRRYGSRRVRFQLQRGFASKNWQTIGY